MNQQTKSKLVAGLFLVIALFEPSLVGQASAPIQVSYPLDYVGEVGSPYRGSLQATGGTPPYQNWTVTSGSLPPGITLDNGSGNFKGTPTAAGIFNFTVTVNDSAGLTSLPGNILIEIVAGLGITTQSLPHGFTGVPYYAVLAAIGGFPPYSWTLSTGVLPPDLALDPAAGVISGTPTDLSGSPFAFKISATDGLEVSTRALTIAILDPASIKITLTSSANPSVFGRALTLNASLSPSTVSGKVTFYDGTAVLGIATVNSGQAVFTTGLLGPGTHQLQVRLARPISATISQVVGAIAAGSLLEPVTYPSANQGAHRRRSR